MPGTRTITTTRTVGTTAPTTVGTTVPATTTPPSTTANATQPCYIDDNFPVTSGCSWPLANGASCTAQTVGDPCLEQGSMTFSCPDATSGSTAVTWAKVMALGSHWGGQVNFVAQNGDLGSHQGVPKRNAQLMSTSGGFDVKCRVCGIHNNTPQDSDAREGHIDVTLEFGPNILNGSVDESILSGYNIYLVNSCHHKRSGVLKNVRVDEGSNGLAVPDMCSCPSNSYIERVTAELPTDHLRDGIVNGEDVMLMIAPVTINGYELPVGLTTDAIQDYFVTTSPTTTTSSTSTQTASTATSTTTVSTTTTTGTTTTGTTSTTTTATTLSLDTETETATMTYTVTNTTTETNTTTTMMTMTTTTYTAPDVAAGTSTRSARTATSLAVFVQTVTVITGSMDLDLGTANATEFASDPAVLVAVTDSLSTMLGVPTEYLEVTITVVNARRLSSQDEAVRRLAGGKVRVEYIIRLPPAAPATVSDATVITSRLQASSASSDMTNLISTNVDARVGAGRYTVTVAAMGVPTVEIVEVTTTFVPGTSAAAPPTGSVVVTGEEEGPSATTAIGATLGTLGVLSLASAGGVYAYKRSRASADVVSFDDCDKDGLRSAGQADEYVDPELSSIFEELAEKPLALH